MDRAAALGSEASHAEAKGRARSAHPLPCHAPVRARPRHEAGHRGREDVHRADLDAPQDGVLDPQPRGKAIGEDERGPALRPQSRAREESRQAAGRVEESLDAVERCVEHRAAAR